MKQDVYRTRILLDIEAPVKETDRHLDPLEKRENSKMDGDRRIYPLIDAGDFKRNLVTKEVDKEVGNWVALLNRIRARSGLPPLAIFGKVVSTFLVPADQTTWLPEPQNTWAQIPDMRDEYPQYADLVCPVCGSGDVGPVTHPGTVWYCKVCTIRFDAEHTQELQRKKGRPTGAGPPRAEPMSIDDLDFDIVAHLRKAGPPKIPL